MSDTLTKHAKQRQERERLETTHRKGNRALVSTTTRRQTLVINFGRTKQICSFSPAPLKQTTTLITEKRKLASMRNQKIFWIFGTLQSISLGTIIYLIFESLNIISEVGVIGFDTQILLSVLFPLFLLIVEYTIYSKE